MADELQPHKMDSVALNATGPFSQPKKQVGQTAAHVAAVVRVRVWTDLFGNPTAEFSRLKESIRFRTSRPVPRIKESPLLRVCAIKDWLPSQDVCLC